MDAPIFVTILAFVGLAGTLLVAYAGWDEWRHPATSYTLGRR